MHPPLLPLSAPHMGIDVTQTPLFPLVFPPQTQLHCSGIFLEVEGGKGGGGWVR
jgi:hypothetical protein